MNITPITDKTHWAIPFILELYEEAFPPHERRTTQQLLALIGHADMQLELVEDEGQPVGFVIWWIIDVYHYIEHIAIHKSARGKQYGSKIILQLLKLSGNKLVLEVEPAESIDAQRRISFYERLGFTIIPFAYMQPPYRKDEHANALLLMSIPAINEESLFNKLVYVISETVYKQFY
ncbi:MAG: GNAT family N-acetyltransferase [Filimonas sp.]|nr:GNAT family N-acetyltransferase [Filimonas sp.]